jgi:hypothetical protein
MGNSSSAQTGSAVPGPPLRRRNSDSSYEEDGHDDGRGCFCANPLSSFCSPRDYSHATSLRGGKKNGKYSDTLGTPVQQTPPNIRRARMERLGLLSSKYEGLEKEAPSVSGTRSGSGSMCKNGSGANRPPPPPPGSAGARFAGNGLFARPMAMPPPGNHTPGTPYNSLKGAISGSMSSVRSAELHEGPVCISFSFDMCSGCSYRDVFTHIAQ